MKPTPEEAKAALSEISNVIQVMRRSISHRATCSLVDSWGCVWIRGYSFSHFRPEAAGFI
ncbi:MAG: hypothetical protein M2R46_03125 [Verrucomicrobia subdivision 3 bacterium]|nr:hypothetical protein [Limisphaerales bacterium]